jgi:hypothetical protein
MTSPPPSSRDPAKSLRVLSLERTHVVVARGPVAVAIWRRPMDIASARIAHEALRDAGKRYPGDAVYINVIRGGVPPPNDDVRRELVAMVRSGASAYRGVAIVALGNAFVVSLVRSVVAGMMMIERPAFPMKVFGDVHDMTAWLAGLGGPPGSAREAEDTFEEASTRLDAKVDAERASRR